MTNKKRVITLILTALFCFAVLFSAVFIIAEAEHDCTGEHCSICYQLSSCENTIKTISLTGAVFAVAVYLMYLFLRSIAVYSNDGCISSLITLKVKLSN